ncbi:MAG: hypothetical protein WCJ07_05695 [Verrucomicrobiota bacterium]
MLKLNQPSSPVLNVIAGQNATLDLNPGPRYHVIDLVATVSKTAATSGFASATLADALGLINIKVNTVSRRQHTAVELSAIQSRWGSDLAAVAFDNVANDLVTAAPDVVVSTNTTRTTTFVLSICLAEPSRDQYAVRDGFAWPTAWASGRRASVQLEISIPNNSGITAPVVRAMETIDYVLGSKNSQGQDVMPITHWYRQPETYAGTNIAIRKWPFTGVIQQMSIFTQESDYIGLYEVKGDNQTKARNSKIGAEQLFNKYGWNSAAVAAGRFDLAFDFTDNPLDSLDTTQFGVFELDVTLKAAAATNKTLLIISQVYRDALN